MLCIVRKPVAFAILADFFNKQGTKQVPDYYPQLSDVDLRALRAHLQAYELIIFYGTNAEAVCTTHPAIRDYFANTFDEGGGRSF